MSSFKNSTVTKYLLISSQLEYLSLYDHLLVYYPVRKDLRVSKILHKRFYRCTLRHRVHDITLRHLMQNNLSSIGAELQKDLYKGVKMREQNDSEKI